MIKNYVLSAAAALALSVTAAQAATLSLLSTGQTHNVSGNDISASFNTEIDMITGNLKSPANGLYLDVGDAGAHVTYTYLGSEAGNTNFAAVFQGGTFINHGSQSATVGEQVTVTHETSGLLDFAFGTVAPLSSLGLFTNNGFALPQSQNFAIGFVQATATSFYVLFDDIARGDRDFDDIAMRIDVAPVPLPAGFLMMLTALMGFGFMRRKQATA